jgi:hypothetical protein
VISGRCLRHSSDVYEFDERFESCFLRSTGELSAEAMADGDLILDYSVVVDHFIILDDWTDIAFCDDRDVSGGWEFQ